jgi:hypothetical protein
VKDDFLIFGKMVTLLDYYGIPGGLDDPNSSGQINGVAAVYS